jgi:electron transport complex protein RnfG
MSAPEAQPFPQPEAPSSFKMVLVMGAVGLIASVLLVATYQYTLPYIEANRAAYLNEAIFDVLPGAAQQKPFVVSDGAIVPLERAEQRGRRLYAGYDDDGQLVGIAIEGQAQGYADVLRLLFGYVPACECVVGMKVLESKETPGLGDKIEKDPNFVANFDSLDVQLDPTRSRLLHQVGLIKQGGTKEAWDIAAITGATISSTAVATIVNDSAEEVLPLIHQHLDLLRQAP